jgi:hypothetical protein
MELNIEKDFLSNVDYLNLLVKKLRSRDVSQYDSNLIYEAVYAHMYLSDIESKAKEPRLVSNIHEIRMSLEAIIDLIPEKDIKNIKTEEKYKDILKAKYNDIKDASYVEEVSYHNTKRAVMDYVYLILPRVGASLVVVCLLMIFQWISGNQIIKIPNNGITSMYELKKILNIVIYLVGIILIITMLMSVTFDLLYMICPWARTIVPFHKNIVSDEAKLAVQMMSETVYLEQVTSYDRIERNKYWLDSMLNNIETMQRSGITMDEPLLHELEKVNSELKAFSKYSKSKDYYYCIAKIEFLHNKYLEELDRLPVICEV